MKNDLKRQCFNLSVSFPPFIKGERGLTVPYPIGKTISGPVTFLLGSI